MGSQMRLSSAMSSGGAGRLLDADDLRDPEAVVAIGVAQRAARAVHTSRRRVGLERGRVEPRELVEDAIEAPSRCGPRASETR